MRCGVSSVTGNFRSEGRPMKCIDCENETEVERKRYQVTYHQARSQAAKALIKLHPEEFKVLLLEERVKKDAKLALKLAAKRLATEKRNPPSD